MKTIHTTHDKDSKIVFIPSPFNMSIQVVCDGFPISSFQ